MYSKTSGVLHVDLIGPDQRILEEKLVKINAGFGDNYFQLQKEYPQGEYTIRAYTQWNRNFRPDFIYKTYVHIYPPTSMEHKESIADVNLVEKAPGKFWLQAK